MSYYEQGYKQGRTHGYWMGCITGAFSMLALCLLVGAFVQ